MIGVAIPAGKDLLTAARLEALTISWGRVNSVLNAAAASTQSSPNPFPCAMNRTLQRRRD